MKQLALKVKNRWEQLALHIRITISMIAVLVLGLSVSATVTYRLFLNMLTNRVGHRVLVDFGGNADPNGSPGPLFYAGPDSNPDAGPETIPLLPREAYDRQKMIIGNGPPRDEFFAKIGQEVNSSLMLFFIATTAAITLLGALCVYFMTRRALRKVQAEQTRLTEFVANASHDLRTPLAVISGYSQLLEADKIVSASENAHEFATHIRANAERMQSLVEDMLLIARLSEKAPESASPSTEAIPEYNLAEFLQAIVADFQQTSTERNILLTNDDILVHFAPEPLRRVVENLLTNADRHAGDDAKISVSCSKTSSQVVLKVSDDGVGVSADKLDYIFERFTKGDTSRSTQGNGLGLSIVKQIVLGMGGSVRAYASDKTTGRGLTVEVTLPV